jgi:hypothetical protein
MRSRFRPQKTGTCRKIKIDQLSKRPGTHHRFASTKLAVCDCPRGSPADFSDSGSPEVVTIKARDASVEEVLAALSSTFDMDYHSSIDLDKRLNGTYVGPLLRVVTRILEGYSFVSEDSTTQVSLLQSLARLLRSPRTRRRVTRVPRLLNRGSLELPLLVQERASPSNPMQGGGSRDGARSHRSAWPSLAAWFARHRDRIGFPFEVAGPGIERCHPVAKDAVDLNEIFRQLGAYTGRILKGEKPAIFLLYSRPNSSSSSTSRPPRRSASPFRRTCLRSPTRSSNDATAWPIAAHDSLEPECGSHPPRARTGASRQPENGQDGRRRIGALGLTQIKVPSRPTG